MYDVPGNAVGAAQQARRLRHIAIGQSSADRRTRDPQAMHLVAVHARHVKAMGHSCGVQHRVIPGALGTEAKVVADQHIAGAQALDQHFLHKILRALTS